MRGWPPSCRLKAQRVRLHQNVVDGLAEHIRFGSNYFFPLPVFPFP